MVRTYLFVNCTALLFSFAIPFWQSARAMKTVYSGLGSILFKRKKFSCSNFWLDDACIPANDVQDRKFPAPIPYALKALTPAVVISKLNKLLMPSHVMLFVFTVVLGTGTTVTRTQEYLHRTR